MLTAFTIWNIVNHYIEKNLIQIILMFSFRFIGIFFLKSSSKKIALYNTLFCIILGISEGIFLLYGERKKNEYMLSG